MADNNYNKVEVLIVGAGPGGLTCAIQLKILHPETEVCVVEKGAEVDMQGTLAGIRIPCHW